jgi:hypothetical protein
MSGPQNLGKPPPPHAIPRRNKNLVTDTHTISSSEPPFDRHDWYIARRTPTGKTKEVRYVIDYYSADPEPTGEPVFYLDIRPAIDSPTAAVERMMRWGGDVWCRASGAAGRERELMQQGKGGVR